MDFSDMEGEEVHSNNFVEGGGIFRLRNLMKNYKNFCSFFLKNGCKPTRP